MLSHLNATDLCLAACVWQKLASDEILWQGLCREQWPEANIYAPPPPEESSVQINASASAAELCQMEERRRHAHPSYRKVYLMLDEGTLTFNSDAHKVSKK